MKSRVTVALACLLAIADFASAAIAIYYDDGQTHTINDTAHESDAIYLDKNKANNPGTHFELQSGGKIAEINPYNRSTITINGGLLKSRRAAIDTQGDNVVTINGGSVIGDVAANNNSRIYMNGGSLINDVTGSTDLYAYDTGICEVRGGSISGILGTWDSGRIYLYGSGFSVDGQAVTPGDSLRSYATLVPYLSMLSGTITGTLQDGSTMNNVFYISPYTSDDIIAVPEPTTLLLLGLGGMAVAAKRRRSEK